MRSYLKCGPDPDSAGGGRCWLQFPGLWRRLPGLVFLWLVGWALAGSQTRGADPDSGFEQANKLYEQSKFVEAAKGYKAVMDSGSRSAALYFNLGNALFKSGQIGRAIVNYRLAEWLDPRDPDIRANLQFARSSVNGGAVQAPWWRRWTSRLTLDEWTILCACALWLWLILLTLVQWRPALRESLRGYTASAGVALAFLLTALCVASFERFESRAAIVTASEAVVR
jgi:tetratricopeptide (TPR) repeat protein